MAVERLAVESLAWERYQKLSAFNHVMAGFVLLLNAMDGLGDPHHRVLAIVEIVAATLLIGSFAVEIRNSRKGTHAHHGRIGWVDLFGAFMLCVEGYSKLQTAKLVGKVGGTPLFLQAAILLGFAFFGHQLRSFRYLSADDEGFEARLSPWRKHQFAWTEISGLRLEPRALVVELGESERRIGLRKMKRVSEILDWTAAQFRQRAIPIQGDESPAEPAPQPISVP